MPQLNVDDIVLLIHGEIASAVTSAQQFGSMGNLALDSVRVRMGQEEVEEQIAINSERYPNSDNGWLIDVMYTANEQKSSPLLLDKTAQKQWLAPDAIAFFSTQPVSLLEGIGSSRARLLNDVGINTVEQLAALSETKHAVLMNKLGQSTFRKLRTMARLSLAVPPIQIPSVFDPLYLTEMLNDIDSILSDYATNLIAEEAKAQLMHWLEQLEFCFDDPFFKSLKFSDMRK